MSLYPTLSADNRESATPPPLIAIEAEVPTETERTGIVKEIRRYPILELPEMTQTDVPVPTATDILRARALIADLYGAIR